MRDGERQVATRLADIRRDHTARYEWAAKRLPIGSKVLDIACGVGYGSYILAKAGHQVTAVDADAEAIEFAEKHWRHPYITYKVGRAEDCIEDEFDAVVCFETIEHLENPGLLLEKINSKRILTSVPNEERFPFKNYKFHHRHYTRQEFSTLLSNYGYGVTEWLGQEGPESEVVEGINGRTTVVDATLGAISAPVPDNSISFPTDAVENVPDHVIILGLGPSLGAYVDIAKRMGDRHAMCDEVWGINSVAGVIQCDRVFHMDDFRVQELRATARPKSNIANMVGCLKKHPGPIYTSVPSADYPGSVAYPLEDVVNSVGIAYFNSTAAYAVAYAIHIGVKQISCFGFDFTYENSHTAERGRACVEFYLGMAKARGIKLGISDRTTLMDGMETNEGRLYGYDGVNVDFVGDETGFLKVSFTPKELPTAEEIESRYDHSKHPNSLVAA